MKKVLMPSMKGEKGKGLGAKKVGAKDKIFSVGRQGAQYNSGPGINVTSGHLGAQTRTKKRPSDR